MEIAQSLNITCKKLWQMKYMIRESSIHNKGVFATMNIKKGNKVIEYVGKKITKKEADETYMTTLSASERDSSNGRVYIFELNSRYDIDGNVAFNDARFVNHACSPNCETEIINNRIWIIAAKDIKRGEEITYNYGYDLDDYKEHPCNCCCCNCVGYIVDEDHWPKLKKLLISDSTPQ